VVPVPDRQARREASPYAPAWDAVRESIRGRILPESFDRWIAPLCIADVKGEGVVIDAPDADVAEWVEEHYQGIIRRALEEAGMPCRDLTVMADSRERRHV